MPSLLPTLAAVGALDPSQLIETFGSIGIILIIFLESCALFFLPGDSLLFFAGFLASRGDLNVAVIAVGTSLAAIAGNQVGYIFGRRVGPGLFKKNSRLFRLDNLEKTHAYFEKHGPKTIVLARFVPIVRTFACIVAGVARMDYRTFVTYNIIGAVLWGGGVTLIGYVVGNVLGEAIDIDKYLLPVVIGIVLLSFIPMGIEYLRHRKTANEAVAEVVDVIEDQVRAD